MTQYTALFDEITREGWQYVFASDALTDATTLLRMMFPDIPAIRLRNDTTKQIYIVTADDCALAHTKRGRELNRLRQQFPNC